MTKILFWNIARKHLIEELVTLCHSEDIDIIVLAESQIREAEILRALNLGREEIYYGLFNTLSSPHLLFFFRYPINCISPVEDRHRTAIRRITPPVGTDFLLVALHLPSKRYRKNDDQYGQARIVSELIREAEVTVGHERTVVIGDFNMSPYDMGIVGADGFHAVMSQSIARKRSRKVDGVDRQFFYNPMWGRMGDASTGPPGTYYYRKDSGYISYFWYTFDQVLLRPDLLNFFSQNDLIVVSKIGGQDLLAQEKISTDLSDHLPIILKLTVEEG